MPSIIFLLVQAVTVLLFWAPTFGHSTLPHEDTTPPPTPTPIAQHTTPSPTPSSRTWAHTYVRHQGQDPICVGEAWWGWEHSDPRPLTDTLQPMDIYAGAQKIDPWAGTPHTGTTIDAGAQFLQKQGVLSVMTPTHDLNQVRDFLLNEGPVVFAVPWHQGMYTPASDFYVIPTGTVPGWHAFYCNNWETAGVDGQSYGCVNSWGDGWGHWGEFRVHLNDMQSLFKEGGYAILAEKK